MTGTPLSIAIDGNEANVLQRVGSNTYAFELLKALRQLAISYHPQVRFTILLSAPPVDDMPRSHKQWRYQVIRPAKLFTQWSLPIYLFNNRQQFQVFFTPGHYAPRWCPIPYVSSVMDIGYLRYPQYFRRADLFQLKNWTQYSVKHASAIVTISHFSRSELAEAYGIPLERIVVAPPALESKLTRAANWSQLSRRLGLRQPYFLHVGTIQPRKNIIGLVEAFEQLLRKQRIKTKPQLVLAGKPGWLTPPILERIAQSPFAPQILVTGYVNEAEKLCLYRYATACCMVGWYEGFGIPALEAIRQGCLPIVANTSSVPEVVGAAGILVNPRQTTAITEALAKALRLKSKEKAMYRKHMREQLRQFSWESSAQTVLQTLQAVVGAS